MLSTQRDADKASDLVKNLRQVMPRMGMNLSPPKMCEYFAHFSSLLLGQMLNFFSHRITLQDDRANTFAAALQREIRPGVEMVVCVVPNNRKERYDMIKKTACIDSPVPSQVVLAKTLSKPKGLMSVATKIAMQINCKMGGALWRVDMPLKVTHMHG